MPILLTLKECVIDEYHIVEFHPVDFIDKSKIEGFLIKEISARAENNSHLIIVLSLLAIVTWNLPKFWYQNNYEIGYVWLYCKFNLISLI